LHGIRLNVRNVDQAEQFFTSLGMVEDIGMRRADQRGELRSVLAGAEIPGRTLSRSVSLRWPCDPYMHLNLVEYGPGAADTGWPKATNQLGSTVLTLLVDDLYTEIERLRGDRTAADSEVVTVDRLLGRTRSLFIRDPDGNTVELLECAPQRGWDHSTCSVVDAERTFLHLQLNTSNFATVSRYYAGFGFAHNPLNNMRAGTTFEPATQDPYLTAFGQSLTGNMTGLNFFTLPDDPSGMHLEVMGWAEGALRDPGPVPTFHQRGIVRYCFKTSDLSALLATLKRRGVHIYQEDQRAPLGWGDSEWFFFADPDGNVLCFEEWFPTGHWGERG
jgi:catechol 2,3-dioxygenase-like lactoylglutathione lyase family enzyme